MERLLAPLHALLLHRHFTLVCGVAFVASRLAVILLIPVDPTSDAKWYVSRALGILAGAGYSEAGLPTAYWPIGYPGFLSVVFKVFGSHLVAAQLANVALGLGTLLLIYRTTELIYRDMAAARIALFLYTVYPNQIAYTAALLSEVLFTFLFLLGAYIFISRPNLGRSVLSGFVMGLATLTKSQTLIFPALMMALYAWSDRTFIGIRRAVSFSFACYAALLLTILPWTIRNYVVFDAVIPVSTNGGLALVVGNNPNATGDHIPDEMLPEGLRPSVADQVEVDRRAKAYAWNWIRENPDEFLKLVPRKIWNLWARDGEGEWWFQAGYRHYADYAVVFRGVRVLNQTLYFVLLLAFAVSLASAWRCSDRLSSWSGFGLMTVLYTTALCSVFSGQSRYHYPIMPWIVIGAAWQFALWLEPRRMEASSDTLRSAV